MREVSGEREQAAVPANESGYTWAELFLVLGVSATLIAVGFAYFPRVQAKAMQAEPQTMLREYAQTMQANRDETTGFVCADEKKSCGWSPSGSAQYHYYLHGESPQFEGKGAVCPSFQSEALQSEGAFQAYAVVNLDDDADCDVWSIDQRGNIRHRVDDTADE